MALSILGSFPLGQINVAANGAVALAVPLLTQFDLAITGSFGLGSLLADLSLQLSAALSAQISLSLSISNPFASLKAQLAAILQIQASITATLALGLPAVSVTLGASISAAAAISALLVAKVGGIQALITAALAVKLPFVNFLGQISAALAAGPIFLLSFGYDGSPMTLAEVGASVTGQFSGGLSANGNTIGAGENVQGIVLLTKNPSAAAAMSFILKTA